MQSHTDVFRNVKHVTVASLAWVLGFLLGIASQTLAPLSFPIIFISGVCVFFGVILWRTFFYHRYVLLLLLLAFGGVCGMLRLEVATWNDTHPVLDARVDTTVTLEGTIVREVDVRAKTAQLYVETQTVNGTPFVHRVLIITERFPRFYYGERIRAEGILELPSPFKTEFERTFDYPGYLAARDMRYTLPFAKVERVEGIGGNPIVRGLLAMKRSFMANIESLLPEPSAGIAEGITLGVKRALGEELEAAFRTTGIIHIVVLSGYNVTIVAEGIMRILSAFVRPKARMLLGILAITAFAIIAGFSPTVVRATLMAGLILYARTTGNAYTTTRALVFAGVIMLLINPHLLIHDPGFQLSFLATLGLIVLAPIIEHVFKSVPNTLQMREFLTATIATQLFILPLLLYVIGELSLVAILVNVLVLPAVPIAMFGTFLTGTLGAISQTLALLPAFGTHMLLVYLVSVVNWFAALPFSSIVVPQFSFWVVLLGYMLLGYTIYHYQHKQKEPIYTNIQS